MWPEFGLSLIDGVVVAVELAGVVVFEEVGEFVEELEHLRGGFAGEVERKVDERRGVLVHGPVSHDAPVLAFRRERALERWAARSLASRRR